MSYSFRDRPRLSDRYRGKSGGEILNELKNQIDHDRQMFFEGSPSWNSIHTQGPFSRSGFPFDDDMPRGHQDIRSHLDDLAQRHPEFADHLRCPPWGGEMGTSQGTFGRKRRGSGSGSDASNSTETSQQVEEQSDQPGPLRGRTRYNHLPQYGLRNTVDLGQQQHESEQDKGTRGQRSWSAPPDNRTPEQPQRFVSRIDINPVNPAAGANSTDNQGKPPVAPKQQQQQKTPTKPAQGGTVRHIPIFVEGRDEPLLPKNVDSAPEQIFSERMPQQQQSSFSYNRPHHFTSHHQFQSPQPNASHTPASNSTPFQQPYRSEEREPKTEKHEQQHPQHKNDPPQQKEQCQPQASQPQAKAPEANDPISKVQTIQKDVDELQSKVEKFTGKSRKDKDFIYLDEMLTRNLLKLDDIETDGKENVRQARKAVIRNIQRCISVLESKVPSPEEQNKVVPQECNTTEESVEQQAVPVEAEVTGENVAPPAEPMNVDVETKEPTKQCHESSDSVEQVADAPPNLENPSVQGNENNVPSSKDAATVGEGKMEVESETTAVATVDGSSETVPEVPQVNPQGTEINSTSLEKPNGDSIMETSDTSKPLDNSQNESQNQDSKPT